MRKYGGSRARRVPPWLGPGLLAALLLVVLARIDREPGGRSAPAPGPPGKTARPAPSGKSRVPPPAAARRGRLAVVIDDVGYKMGPLRELLAIEAPMTLAVIPHQRHSRRAAELAHERGREVMLHLPMEPVAYPEKDPGEGALLTGMDAEEMRRTVREALSSVPHARGLNNHMGSRMTGSGPAMELLMKELDAHHLYFLDSRTAADSVALEAARAARVRCLQRDVFLDDRRERPFIEEQLERAVERALSRGSAVAIGHPHPVTLEVLRRELPRLQARGVRLVFASELAS